MIRALVEQQPEVLDGRLSCDHNGQTPLQYAMARSRLDILDLLIELGAITWRPTVRPDGTGIRAAATGPGGAERLRAADAPPPSRRRLPSYVRPRRASPLGSRRDARRRRADVGRTLACTRRSGSPRGPVSGRNSVVFSGRGKIGKAEFTFDVRDNRPASGVSLLVTTGQSLGAGALPLDLASRQLGTADVQFVKTLHEPEHGGLEFSILVTRTASRCGSFKRT